MMRTRFLLLGLFLPFSCESAVANTEHGAPPSGGGEAVREDRLVRGARLYDAHCAVCHGKRGAGDGPASPFLFPEARDFTQARFRLVSTANGVPTDDDIERTIRRGVPGSAMPAWHWMGEDDVRSLVGFVRRLATEGVADALFAEGQTAEEAVAEASARLVPGPVLPRVGAFELTRELVEQGSALYRSRCASCHGVDGAGRREPAFDEDGSLNWPRDFTAGYLKGGRGADALGWRIQAGLPGTAMAGTSLDEGELRALVAYLRHEIPADVETNLVHRQERILAARVDAVPESPGDPSWGAFETPVVLAPLYHSRLGNGITRAYVSARHDGELVAVRVRWADESGDLRIYSDLGDPDACALQLTVDENPRLFGMGSATHRTSIWHWKALRLSEVAGALDLLDSVPHARAETFRGRVRTDVPVYRPSLSVPEVSETVESLRASGVGETEPQGGAVDARPSWSDGQWAVVFTRSCDPTAEGEVAIVPGARLSVALAIWNGRAGDHGARKSISIWQVLELEP